MPIKLPKAPFRRKSSGNVLDTIENPPATSSFRVLNRVDLEERGFHRTSSDVNLKPPAGKRTISSPWGHKRASRSTDAALELDGEYVDRVSCMLSGETDTFPVISMVKTIPSLPSAPLPYTTTTPHNHLRSPLLLKMTLASSTNLHQLSDLDLRWTSSRPPLTAIKHFLFD